MQFTIGADTVTPSWSGFSVPVSETPPSFSQNGNHGSNIPSIANGVHHDVRTPSRHHQVAVSITPTTAYPAGILELLQCLTRTGLPE